MQSIRRFITVTLLSILILASASFSPAQASLPKFKLDSPVAVTGLFNTGQTLTISTPFESGVTFTFEWLADAESIPNATAQSLLLGSSEAGKSIYARVTAHKTGFRNVTLTALGSAVVTDFEFSATSSATINGVQFFEPYCLSIDSLGLPEPTIGWNVWLNCNFYNTSFGATTSTRYQWYRGDALIPDSDSSSYNVKPKDASQILSGSVRASFANGAEYWGFSRTGSVVHSQVVTSMPKISGTIKDGFTITASTKGFDHLAHKSYRWYRDFALIPGATSKSYVLKKHDSRHRIQVLVIARREGFIAASRISNPVGKTSRNLNALSAYQQIKTGYSHTDTQYDISYELAPHFTEEMLARERLPVQNAADFWSSVYIPHNVKVLLITQLDGEWADGFLASQHPTWRPGSLVDWISNNRGNFAIAFPDGGSQVFILCRNTDNNSDANWGQVSPHEYTHWVQFSKSELVYSNLLKAPWLVEGQANFYGLALGAFVNSASMKSINTSLSDNAVTFDETTRSTHGTLKLLKMLESGNTTDIYQLLRRWGTVHESYLLGTLMSEWLVLKYGHAKYWHWFSTVLEQKDVPGVDTDRMWDSVTRSNFGMSLNDLELSSIPYLALRASQLEVDWQSSQNRQS
jgi:hypothetical protein